MLLYRNPASQKKLQEAIDFGFIIRHTDPDGVERFILTDKGFFQYITENMQLRTR